MRVEYKEPIIIALEELIHNSRKEIKTIYLDEEEWKELGRAITAKLGYDRGESDMVRFFGVHIMKETQPKEKEDE